MSREDEFVDIEGDDMEEGVESKMGALGEGLYDMSGIEPFPDNSLAQDLQITPDNSDDESSAYRLNCVSL